MEIRCGGVGELVGAGGADEIGHGDPVHQIRGRLDRIAAPRVDKEREPERATG